MSSRSEAGRVVGLLVAGVRVTVQLVHTPPLCVSLKLAGSFVEVFGNDVSEKTTSSEALACHKGIKMRMLNES